jgi:hypothetical protein
LYALAVLLAWCSVAAAGFALIALPAPRDIPWPLYRSGAALYAVLGTVAAVALWRHAPNAPTLFARWAVVATIVCALPGLTMPEAAGFFRIAVIGTALAIGIACVPVHSYIRSAVLPPA